MHIENEFRVRPVQRFILTHFSGDGQKGRVREIGEFANVEAAEEVGVALQALVPNSTLATIDGRQAEYPPKALAAAMAVRRQLADVPQLLRNIVDGIESGMYKADVGVLTLRGRDGSDPVVFGLGPVGEVDPYNELDLAHRLIESLSSPEDSKPCNGPPMQYAIVERTVGDVDCRTWYAEWPEEAEQHRLQLQNHYGREFRIYSRPVTDPITLARRSLEVKPEHFRPLDLDPPHTNYPSLYAIGDLVIVKNFPATVVGVRFTGDGHDAPGKVFYEVRWFTKQQQPIEEFPSEDVYPHSALKSL